MKKLVNSLKLYYILAMIAGVFFREYTKLSGFTGETVLGAMHGHLFGLGVMFFLLIIAIALNKKEILEDRNFNKFFKIYNVSLIGMVVMMLVRGITEVQGSELSKAIDASISGVAGLFHIAITVALYFFFKMLTEEIK